MFDKTTHCKTHNIQDEETCCTWVNLVQNHYMLRELKICETNQTTDVTGYNTLDQEWANSGPHVARNSVFSGPRSIQENLQIWTILQLIAVNFSAEANLYQDLLGTALRYARPSQSGPRA